jgi:hypothetical protein
METMLASETKPRKKAAVKIKEVPFSISIELAGQTVMYTEIYTIGDLRLKIVIGANSYRDQCTARSYVWRPEQRDWSQVASIPSGAIDTPLGMYVWREKIKTSHAEFENCRRRLKHETHFVLALG